jgi:hypothetical protein
MIVAGCASNRSILSVLISVRAWISDENHNRLVQKLVGMSPATRTLLVCDRETPVVWSGNSPVRNLLYSTEGVARGQSFVA